MHQAFIKNAEHDVDHHQRGKYQQGLLVLRLLRVTRRALKTAAHIAGHADVGLGLPDRRPAVVERFTFCHVVRNRGCKFAILVTD